MCDKHRLNSSPLFDYACCHMHHLTWLPIWRWRRMRIAQRLEYCIQLSNSAQHTQHLRKPLLTKLTSLVIFTELCSVFNRCPRQMPGNYIQMYDWLLPITYTATLRLTRFCAALLRQTLNWTPINGDGYTFNRRGSRYHQVTQALCKYSMYKQLCILGVQGFHKQACSHERFLPVFFSQPYFFKTLHSPWFD